MSTIESIRRRLEQGSGSASQTATVPHPWDVAGRLMQFYARCEERWRSRRALEMLDERGLRDIGITRAEADREISKSFWN